MKVRVYGFTWTLPAGENIVDFLTHVQAQNQVNVASLDDIADELNFHRIMVVCPMANGIWGGFLLTVKNARRFVQAQKVRNAYHITTATIENEDQRFSEINFFIFNTASGSGLYEHYFLSPELTSLNAHAVGQHMAYAAINQLQSRLRCTSYLTPTDFADRVAALRKLHNIEYEFSTFRPPPNTLIPASDFLNRQSLKAFVHPRYQEGEGVRAAVAEFAREQRDNLKKLRVKGQDAAGEEVFYSLFHDASIFREYNFDDFTVDLMVDEEINNALPACANLTNLLNLSNQAGVTGFFNANVNP